MRGNIAAQRIGRLLLLIALAAATYFALTIFDHAARADEGVTDGSPSAKSPVREIAANAKAESQAVADTIGSAGNSNKSRDSDDSGAGRGDSYSSGAGRSNSDSSDARRSNSDSSDARRSNSDSSDARRSNSDDSGAGRGDSAGARRGNSDHSGVGASTLTKVRDVAKAATRAERPKAATQTGQLKAATRAERPKPVPSKVERARVVPSKAKPLRAEVQKADPAKVAPVAQPSRVVLPTVKERSKAAPVVSRVVSTLKAGDRALAASQDEQRKTEVRLTKPISVPAANSISQRTVPAVPVEVTKPLINAHNTLTTATTPTLHRTLTDAKRLAASARTANASLIHAQILTTTARTTNPSLIDETALTTSARTANPSLIHAQILTTTARTTNPSLIDTTALTTTARTTNLSLVDGTVLTARVPSRELSLAESSAPNVSVVSRELPVVSVAAATVPVRVQETPVAGVVRPVPLKRSAHRAGSLIATFQAVTPSVVASLAPSVISDLPVAAVRHDAGLRSGRGPEPVPPGSPLRPGSSFAGSGHLRDAGGGGNAPPTGTVPSSWRPEITAAAIASPIDASAFGRSVRYSGPPS
ncbi:hypothetical protein JIG36_35255 [Actinoplanes sp. LDG1-06]|uniref:Uncharacterized protein n=1 Tax=Paractinoplanes ovalisporus TaxID=2810368 RepID=A0ABS2ALR1_9ACTN|nr:hypothetical protein [Actinoplanes ovalisporus]MBM2620771.1 hypothetical protein [Actinoplanes ovalisporus]